jgi:hypothetical protein
MKDATSGLPSSNINGFLTYHTYGGVILRPYSTELELMAQLKEKTKSLILLSATPMQIDAIEVFDLLNLLGLQGHWSYGDNFCYYFASLQGAVKQEVINFWQVMSSDYFQRGGQPCSRLEQFLIKSDRILAYKMQDTWLSYEESHYWFAKISNGKRNQALKAIRVLLGD